MKQPTEEQIKEFWEWCGFTISGGHWWSGYKWGEEKHYFEKCPPIIDLNNLFKHAVPKLKDKYLVNMLTDELGTDARICLKGDLKLVSIYQDKDPALALFWALWQVKEASNDR